MIHATPARSLRPVTRITLAVVVAASSAFVAGGLLAASRADATPILPTVSSISPSTGTSAGGTTVRINGLNLSTTTAVQFGSSSVSFTYVPPPVQRPFGVVSPRGLPPAGYTGSDWTDVTVSRRIPGHSLRRRCCTVSGSRT